MTDFKLLTVKQAARHLSMSEAWLFASDVPFVKLGGSRRYRQNDLDDYVRNNRKGKR